MSSDLLAKLTDAAREQQPSKQQTGRIEHTLADDDLDEPERISRHIAAAAILVGYYGDYAVRYAGKVLMERPIKT